ncbi:hypothetical protein FDECE_13497 [Fusarium decemcellulare]|nr:hypothetical protein FDECE_13497 [Fusarium decemcellulare]
MREITPVHGYHERRGRRSPTPEVQSPPLDLTSDSVAETRPTDNLVRPASGDAALVESMGGERNTDVCCAAAKEGLPTLRTNSANELEHDRPVDNSHLPITTLMVKCLTGTTLRTVYGTAALEHPSPSDEEGDEDDGHDPRQQGLKRDLTYDGQSDTDEDHKRLCLP